MATFGKTISVMAQVRRINKALNNVAAACEGPVGDTLFTQAALVASEIRSVAPVDDTSPTPGALKASVRVEQGKPTATKAIVVKIKAGGQTTKKTSANGSSYDYARAVEFSTQDMPARPFFFPIWRARRKDVRSATKKAIKNAVRNVFT